MLQRVLPIFLSCLIFGMTSGSMAATPVLGGNSAERLTSLLALSHVSSPFEEALLAEYTPSDAERVDLQLVVDAYRQQGVGESLSNFESYLQKYPSGAYRVSLLTNLGLQYYHYGYFSKAISAWQSVWDARGKADGSSVRPLIDRSVGELIRMHARLGHAAELEKLLNEVEGRSIIGQATEAIAGAREGLWSMKHNPGVAFLCGPMALKNLVDATSPQSQKALDLLKNYRSGPRGVSLSEVSRLAKKAGLPFVPAYRKNATVSVPVPSVVHWRVNHYAAVIDFKDGKYHIKDPTFGDDLWVSPDALEAESSGYFLLAPEQLVDGWRLAKAEESNSVYGRGQTSNGDAYATSNEDVKYKSDACSQGCAKYNVSAMLTSLNIEDTPVGYKPAYGPVVELKLSYNQREATQPTTFAFSNVGQKWSHNWLSYVQDDPTTASANVLRVMPGGGARTESGYSSSTGAYTPSRYNKATLVRTASSPVQYELRNTDGSVLVYAQSDGSVTNPRRVFLSRIVDPFGNGVTLGYDALNRLVTITDAAGGVNTLEYGSSASAYFLTKFTNPAGQSASITYNSSGLLQSITDAVGMVSSFTYSSDFVSKMTTPYGDTNFAFYQSGTSSSDTLRWLVATDPMGFSERFEFHHNVSSISASDSVVPTGFSNIYLQWRNGFYWDKYAYSLYGASLDYTKAEILHFLHTSDGKTSRTLESRKKYPDNRVWYAYAGQSSQIYEGTFDQPIKVAQVLPDGSSQVSQFEYNSMGAVSRLIDPVGRDVYLDYASNGIDMAAVRRKTSTSAYTALSGYTYNSMHQPLTMVDAAGQTTSYTYKSTGQLSSVAAPDGGLTRYYYGGDGYLAWMTDAAGVPYAVFEYDAAGNLTRLIDSESREVTYEYDALNRRTKANYMDGTSEVWVYDRLDVAAYTNRLGVTTSYTYDANRQLLDETQPIDSTTNRVVRYTYFPTGQLKTLADGNGNITTWERDLRGRITRKIYADGKGDVYTYDSVGRLLTKKDALNQVTTWGYTADNKVASRVLTGAVNSTPSVSYTWDSYYPRLSAMADGVGTTSYTYVQPGQLGALRLLCDSGVWSNTAICYSYDAMGRMVGRTVQTADGTDSSSWVYDVLGRVSSENLGKLGAFSYTYLGETGLVSGRVGPSGLSASFTYEGAGNDLRLSGIQHAAPVSTLGNLYAYQTNALNQIVQVGTGLASTESRKIEDFAYDEADRLYAKSVYTSTPGVADSGFMFNNFRYDAADNLKRILGNASYDTLATYTVNNLNQAIAGGAGARTYDASGNLTADGSLTYTWDGQNRLATAALVGSGVTTTWAYDAMGRRSVMTDTSGLVERYRWCGQELCAILDSSNKIKSLLYGDRGEYSSTAGAMVYSEDHLGNVRHVNSAATGAWLLSVDYESLGAIHDVKCNTTASCFMPANGKLRRGYAGLYFHAASGLYFGTYRAYDPFAGRWLNRDPIEESGGINLYAYVGGNPISFIDPEGLIRYNAPPPRTVPVEGETYTKLACVEACLQNRTGNDSLDLLITGGAEKKGHSSKSYHYQGKACDVAQSNPVSRPDMNACAASCGFGGGQFEVFPNNPGRDHWHLQTTPGNGVPAITPGGNIPNVYPKH